MKMFWIEEAKEGEFGSNWGDCLIFGEIMMIRRDEGDGKTPYARRKIDSIEFDDYLFFASYEEFAAYRGEPDPHPFQITDDRGILICKGCGNDNLHRIPGVGVAFSCEHCDHVTQLNIEDHKGNVFIEAI